MTLNVGVFALLKAIYILEAEPLMRRFMINGFITKSISCNNGVLPFHLGS